MHILNIYRPMDFESHVNALKPHIRLSNISKIQFVLHGKL